MVVSDGSEGDVMITDQERIADLERQLAEFRSTSITSMNARPAACESMLQAMREELERQGVHRNFHNAASIKHLGQERTRISTERDTLRGLLRELKDGLTCRITYNLCGTDTRPVGQPCECGNCKRWERITAALKEGK